MLNNKSRETSSDAPPAIMKTVYALRIRPDDNSAWSEPEFYRTRKERDHAASVSRIIGGIRTHSYEEKKTPDEVEAICG